jgi:hypothetical protein
MGPHGPDRPCCGGSADRLRPAQLDGRNDGRPAGLGGPGGQAQGWTVLGAPARRSVLPLSLVSILLALQEGGEVWYWVRSERLYPQLTQMTPVV